MLIVDDYGHHPTEIKATLGAARTSYPDRFIRAVWQPHTYTRTTTLAGDFLQAFQDADQVIILDVYEAREERPEGFQTADLAAGMDHQNALYLPELPQAAAYLEEQLKPGDLVLVFSAGDAIEINDRLEGFLLAESESREENNHGS